MTPTRHLKVVPSYLLWLLFGSGIAAALFLVPSDAELAHRLIADGKQERALEIATESGAGKEAERIAREIGAVSTPEPEGPPAPEIDAAELFAITLADAPRGKLDDEQVQRIAAVLERAPGTRDEFAHVAARCRDLSRSDVESLYGLFAKKALGRGDPAFAAEVYTKMRALVPKPSPATVASMVQTYRFNSRPLEALELLESRFDPSDLSTVPRSMRDTLVALYFESSQPGRAFQLLKAEINETNDPELLTELMPRAVQAASYSNHGDQMVPLLERFLQNMPESRMTLAELVEEGRSDRTAADRPFVRFAKLFAQQCEWNDRYDSAFDYYCKAAALGDEACLERCIDLHESLFRQEDLGKLMFALAPFEGDAKPRRTRLLAYLLGGAGRYQEGENAYEEYLSMVPDDVDALVALAALRSEAGDLRAALETYFVARKERPGDIDLITRTAELHIALGEHRPAFDLFRSIPAGEHTELSLEHLLMLASSLDESAELNRAQIIAFGRVPDGKHTADHFLDLAETYALKGDTKNELAVLSGGLEALPSSTKLALTYADSLYRESRFTEAAGILARDDLKDNVRALALFIEICGGTDRFEYAMQHLPEGIEHQHYFSPSIRIELGQIYEESGDFDSADELYASVPEGREAWQLLASAKYRKGDFSRAEDYQRKYLRAALEPDAQDWMFMGDIYKSQGKVRQADEAYRRSLMMLKSRL